MLMVEAGDAGSLPRATLARHAGQSPSGAFSGNGCRHWLQIRIVSIFQPFVRPFTRYRRIFQPK
jgi:hypothetical protein